MVTVYDAEPNRLIKNAVEKLRGKPGGGGIPVHMGTFADFELKDRFALVFVVFNTLFALSSQTEQVSCFRSVANVLAAGGRFLVEAFVPDVGRFDRGQTLRTVAVGDARVRLECSLHERHTQTVNSQLVDVSGEGVALYPIRIRYAWPAEIDLMAQLAGLALLERWGGWRREPFTADSTVHVSVYGRPGA